MNNKICIIMLLLIILLEIIIIYKINYPKEDVNRDGKVNSLDLLIVQKRILEEMESDK